MKMKPGLPEAAALALDLIKATWPVNHGQRRVGEAWGALERALADDPGPDLLAALESCLAVMAYYHRAALPENVDHEDVCENPENCGHCKAAISARSAIAKATGGQP